MKISYLGFALAVAVAARADVVYLTDGKTITGRVTGYARMTFDVEDDKGSTSRQPQAKVKKIEFTDAEASVTTVNRGPVKGQLVTFENSQFVLKTADGEERVATTFVKDITVAGSGSGKDVDQVTGSDLAKYIPRGKVTIVDFYADWCGPCRMIGPHLEKLAKDDDAVVLRKVNVDKNGALAAKYNVRGIPHILVFDKAGKEAGKIVGADPDGVKQLVAKAKGS